MFWGQVRALALALLALATALIVEAVTESTAAAIAAFALFIAVLVGLAASLTGEPARPVIDMLERIATIVVTHTHRDHSPGARRLAARTGAPIVGCAPHRAARALAEGEVPRLDASADRDHAPDRIMAEGDVVSGPGWTRVAVETPGHTMNHLAFALPEARALAGYCLKRWMWAASNCL